MITAHSDGKGFRYLETEGFVSNANAPRAIVVPFRQSKGGSNGSAFSIAALKDTNIASPSLITTNEENGFKIRHYPDVKINGKGIDPSKVYEYDKWYVVTLPLKPDAEFNKVRFGANQHANSVRLVAVGSGAEFVEGNISKVSEKAKEIMTKYGIDE